MDINSFKLDPVRLEHGTYWEISLSTDGNLVANNVPGPSPAKGWVRVVRPGIAFTRAEFEARKPFLDKIRAGKLTDAEEGVIQGLSQVNGGVLAEWGNFFDGKTPLPWSRETALKLLVLPEWGNLRNIITAIADNKTAILHRQEEDAKGNSQADSDGSLHAPVPVGTSSSSSALQNVGSD